MIVVEFEKAMSCRVEEDDKSRVQRLNGCKCNFWL